jgi:hypothetical protein
MKRVKAKVGLSRSPYWLQPVNATAKRVAGIDRNARNNRLLEQIAQAKRAAQCAGTPDKQAAAKALIADLRKQMSGGDLDIGPRAIRKAQKAMERAKWMRDNSRP